MCALLPEAGYRVSLSLLGNPICISWPLCVVTACLYILYGSMALYMLWQHGPVYVNAVVAAWPYTYIYIYIYIYIYDGWLVVSIDMCLEHAAHNQYGPIRVHNCCHNHHHLMFPTCTSSDVTHVRWTLFVVEGIKPLLRCFVRRFLKELVMRKIWIFADQLSQTAASLPGANVKHPSSAAVWAYAHLDLSFL